MNYLGVCIVVIKMVNSLNLPVEVNLPETGKYLHVTVQSVSGVHIDIRFFFPVSVLFWYC